MDFIDDTESASALLSSFGFNHAAQSGQMLCWVCIDILLVDPEIGQPTAAALEDLFYGRRQIEEQIIGSYRDISTRLFCPLCRLIFQLLSNDKRFLPTTSSPTATEGACVISKYGRSPPELRLTYITPEPSSQPKIRQRGKIVLLSNEYPRPPSPGNFLEKHALLTEYYLATHRATRSSNLLDIDFVKSCLASCEQNHTACRHAGANDQSPAADIFLINVQEECLEPGTTSNRYFALSYVWGDASKFYQTQDEDVVALRQPGSLAHSANLFNVPETVRDAMTLTKQLGEKYLWVDALCIIQDNSGHRTKQLRMMDRIYRHALMTVVAMSAQDARSGLPGIGTSGTCPRKRIMPIESIQAFEAGYSLTIEPPELGQVIHWSTWSTRAWTFQEQFLSRRCLYLSDWQAYFKCQGTRAVGECERPQDIVSAFAQHNDEYYGTIDRLNLPTSLRSWDDGLSCYQTLVAYYLRRTMSREYDILNAFEGVAAFLQAQLGGRLFAGIPEAVIDICLLWAPVKDITRRKVPGFNFPSWSWAGWIGKADQAWDISFLWETLGIGLGHVSEGYLPYWPEVLRSEIGAMVLEVDGALVEVNRIVSTLTTTADQDELKVLAATAELGGHQHLLHFLAQTTSTRGFSVTGGQIMAARWEPGALGEKTMQPATCLFDGSGVACGIVLDKERNCVWDFDDDERYGFVLLSQALEDESFAPSCILDLVKSGGGMTHVLAGAGSDEGRWGVCFALLVEWQAGSKSRCQRLAVCQITASAWEAAARPERRYIQLG